MTGIKAPPLVSVIMSNYNGAAYLEDAVASVLAQSHRALELVIADDASTDDSVVILRRLARHDARVKPIELSENAGPAAARNAALDAAQGDWIAIIDADDLIHPERITRLLAAADAEGADMIADDLVSFGAADTAGQTLLSHHGIDTPHQITPAAFYRSDGAATGLASFGYLKPVIRRGTLGPLRYNEALRIGEDFDLYARLLVTGARFMVVPDPTYLYRRHASSISHRLSVSALAQLLAAHDALPPVATRDVKRAMRRRRAGLSRALQYQQLVDALKARRWASATGQLLRRPGLLWLLGKSLAERRRKKTSKPEPDTALTVVLAAAAQLDAVPAPPDALCIKVERDRAPTALAAHLAKLATQGPVEIIARGEAGLNALGYVPRWGRADLHLDAEAACHAALPRNVTLHLLPQR